MALFIVLVIVVLFGFLSYYSIQKTPQIGNNLAYAISPMTLTSSAFRDNEVIPRKYTCEAAGARVPLTIGDVPYDTKSLALVVDDPDAPSGTFTHWTVWNISPTTTEITEKGLPAGAVEGMTSFGKIGWGAPCPPLGTHRYYFKLYALNSLLNLPATTTLQALTSEIQSSLLAQVTLRGSYTKRGK